MSVGKKRRLCGEAVQPDNSSQASLNTFGPDRTDQDGTCSRHVAERLSKLEQLFERFVCRKNTSEGTLTDAPRSPTLSASKASEKMIKPLSPPSSSDTQSMSSIGDGIVSLPVGVVLVFTYSCSLARNGGVQHHPFALLLIGKRRANPQTVMRCIGHWSHFYPLNKMRTSSSSPPTAG